jgi:hypothetical protein
LTVYPVRPTSKRPRGGRTPPYLNTPRLTPCVRVNSRIPRARFLTVFILSIRLGTHPDSPIIPFTRRLSYDMLAIPPRPYDLSARSIRPMGGAAHHLDLDEEDSRALASAWAHRHATVLDVRDTSATTTTTFANGTITHQTTALLPTHVDVPAVGEVLTILRLTSNVLAGAMQFVSEQMAVVEQLESALTSGNEVCSSS